MSYDLMFKKANILYENGNFDEAEKLYRCIIETVPENPDILNMLGLTAQAKGLHKEAISYFSQAIKITPQHIPLYFNLAVSYQNTSKYMQAIEAYNKVLELNPNIKEVYNNLGAVYEKLNDKQKALQLYQNAIKLDEDYIEAQVNIAVLNNDIQTLDYLSKKYPFSDIVLYYLAQNSFENTDFNSALNFILKAETINNNSFEIKLLKAKINLSLQDIQTAKQSFYEAQRLNPKCVETWLNLANIEENEAFYLKALDLAPDNVEAHSNYANLLYKQNRSLEALEEYRKAVILNPDLPELSNNLALVLKDMSDYERALDLFMNAFLKDKNKKEYWVNIAETLVLLYQQEQETALKIAKKWFETAPDNIFAKHTLNSFNGETAIDNQYTQELFNIFASTYDNTMQKIKYAVLDKISQLNINFKGNILDLGCGTGSFALKFANNDLKITGVDISQNMLDIAAQKGIYHKLVKDDINNFLSLDNLMYDFVLALDVFEYVPNIENTISMIKGDTLIFNIEKSNPEIKTFSLNFTGRYQHNPQYIQTILEKSGYKTISKHEMILRQENEKSVDGVLFIASK